MLGKGMDSDKALKYARYGPLYSFILAVALAPVNIITTIMIGRFTDIKPETVAWSFFAFVMVIISIAYLYQVAYIFLRTDNAIEHQIMPPIRPIIKKNYETKLGAYLYALIGIISAIALLYVVVVVLNAKVV
jgi:hypothetical protein